VREAKALVPSAWHWASGTAEPIRFLDLARGIHRSPDPWLGVSNDGSQHSQASRADFCLTLGPRASVGTAKNAPRLQRRGMRGWCSLAEARNQRLRQWQPNRRRLERHCVYRLLGQVHRLRHYYADYI
jgi:hypothetical protein